MIEQRDLVSRVTRTEAYYRLTPCIFCISLDLCLDCYQCFL
uniref:Uncharacterized protein n=1 Tax=Anguilla anguilla TaxID=7936 RepID=A0A0E9WHN4_ANGAN